jgi:hypothetical protein
MICSICNFDKISGVFNNNIIYCDNCVIMLNNKLILLNIMKYNNLIYFRNESNKQYMYNNQVIQPTLNHPIQTAIHPVVQHIPQPLYNLQNYKK